MRKKEKGVWIAMHILCIGVLIICIWKNQRLFPEASMETGKAGLEQTTGNEPSDAGTSEDVGHASGGNGTQEDSSGEGNEENRGTTGETGGNGTQGETPSGEGNEENGGMSEEAGDGETGGNGTQGEAPFEEENKENGEMSEEAGDRETDGNNGESGPGETDVLALLGERREHALQAIADGVYQALDGTMYEWCFGRKKNHMPSGNGAIMEGFPKKIADFSAFYLNESPKEGDKVIYLTFDCGYENGYTPLILDTLEKHNAKAMFFVTKAFLQSKPEYVRRMKEEGHLVGNHTMSHPVMPTQKEETLVEEILGCAELCYKMTGYEMDPFLRPPTGAYSERTLRLTKDLGFSTIFWSIAYLDYDVNNQPGKNYVVGHFKEYHHNGAIPLIHNTSSSNAEALDEVLTMLENEGYRFGSLYELVERE